MAEPKEKPKSTLREPKPKKSLGLNIRPALPHLRDPHEDLIKPSMPSLPSLTTPTRQSPAPQRDFTKTANSIVREAVPSGSFKGKSKQLYDCLYAMTRGAIVPARTVRISRPRLMAKAHIGARITFEANIKHLQSVGLIVVRQIAGEHEGNEYEVFLPEESVTSQSSMTSQSSHAQKQDRLVSLESSQTRHTSSLIESTTSESLQTSFKTNTERSDDDVALAAMVEALKTATREITGRDISIAESERWKELADVLIAELRIAAARTTVSSVPAFLAEHLRRRLWKLDKKQARAEGRELPDEVATTAPREDASLCPDCSGSSWWYPDGEGKGVAKCKHARLGQMPGSGAT
jgi:hypothetical protein